MEDVDECDVEVISDTIDTEDDDIDYIDIDSATEDVDVEE